MSRRAIDPNGAVGGDSVELQFQVLISVRRIEFELPSIPTDTATAIALTAHGAGIKGLFYDPVVG